jgi:S-formylglutathione hydrolase FrmB
MALLQATFLSGSLLRKTEVNIILPADAALPGMPDNRPYRSLYLLHGYMGSNTDWMLNMPLEELSQRYNLAIVMPSGENSFYTDWKAPSSRYSSFVGRELVEFTRKLLPLSDKREDTLIAGLSMGGYGALYNGLKHYETFGRVIALSAALVYDDIVNSAATLGINHAYFDMIYHDAGNVMNTEFNLDLLAKRVKTEADSKNLPLDLYIACGWNDMLVNSNRDFARTLKKLGVNHVYEECAGTHEWPIWRDHLQKGLARAYPAPADSPPMPFWIEKPGEFEY